MQGIWRPLLLLLILVFSLNFFYDGIFGPPPGSEATISYSRFRQEIAADNIKKVQMKGNSIRGEFRKKTQVTEEVTGKERQREVAGFFTMIPAISDPTLMTDLRQHNVEIMAASTDTPIFMNLLIYLFPWLLILGVWWFAMRGMRQQGPGGVMGGFAKSGAKLATGDRVKTTFHDVAGMDEAKQELKEIVEYLKDPAKFQRLGGKVPHGVLLFGPPGTGKTLLAKAVAGEAAVPFFSISASQFIEMFVGVGASRVRDLFENARKSAPSIIFIDELDAVGRSRGAGLGGGHDEREQTLNQLLSEMDGFEAHEEVVVLAATNRPDVLDSALMRPGRFDRHVTIERPDWRDREKILQVHTRKIKLAPDVDLAVLAKGTPGMVGADLENMVNEAAILAGRDNREMVGMEYLERAKDKVLMGGERRMFMSEKDKLLTAYHEGGHTLVAKLLPNTDPIHKVTILPRGRALGVTQQLPEDDRYHYQKSYLMSRLAVILGGRGAERLIYGELSTGASNDLKVATELAEKMVCQWGMSERIGAVTVSRGEEHPFLGMKLGQEKTFSEQMAWMIDQEIAMIIKDAELKADEVLAAHRHMLDALAKRLVEEETLDARRVDEVIASAAASAMMPAQ